MDDVEHVCVCEYLFAHLCSRCSGECGEVTQIQVESDGKTGLAGLEFNVPTIYPSLHTVGAAKERVHAGWPRCHRLHPRPLGPGLRPGAGSKRMVL